MIFSGLVTKLVLGGVAASAVMGLGWKVGHGRGTASMERQLERVTREARDLIVLTRTERDQCHAEVAKINTAQMQRAEAIAADLQADRKRTVSAQRELDAVARYIVEQQELNMSLVRQAEGMLKNAEDKCSGALVGADFHRVLNQLANPPALVRDGTVPATGGGD